MMNDLASTAAQSLNRDPMVGLRLARVGGFEPAIALGPDELPVYQRRFAMLFADDATMRRGGIGRVTRAVNAQGEAVALKQLILPTRDEFDDDAAYEALVAKFKAAFREEYECHRALSGLKGFPRLYGWGEVDGVPAIVMEWVEGETLARLRPRLAVDDAGRLSPLVAARLGRDLFDLLCRMNLVGEGFVHRDISPANIMVRTARLPLDQQLAEGTFDLCLIDFGSSLALEPASAVAGTGGKESFTERYSTLRRATVAYAPPEMLTCACFACRRQSTCMPRRARSMSSSPASRRTRWRRALRAPRVRAKRHAILPVPIVSRWIRAPTIPLAPMRPVAT